MIPAVTAKPQRTRAEAALHGKSTKLFNLDLVISFLFLILPCSINEKTEASDCHRWKLPDILISFTCTTSADAK
ncbi:hypothetical protein DXD46_06465 [Phocaeicola vulgatus]|uniref:Uncharacterized protein n=1 Tax=Phocaeicola vulgatus TaxID=821 RepID=A0A3E4JR89_PHOVU|nr:hypothetical protein DXD46_06465 [Phocaeicola vulgatus]